MPRRVVRCGICTSQDSKYSCPSCFMSYCSTTCFQEHKANFCVDAGPARASGGPAPDEKQLEPKPKLQLPSEEEMLDAPVLKPLTSLKWPYIPDEPSYADPLKRDEPKPLQLHHYEAIATSPAIRTALSSNLSLPPLLRKLDQLRGTEREEALESLLGVTTNRGTPHRQRAISYTTEEVKALKQLAEAVEKAVRGEKTDALGLDWVEDR